ncbi:MAG TPA: Gfo/Idh/MocA family oxidoreductase [bacterium]|nr:Gfo/Idh/MocA family oxidoreductase [bacterium]HPN45061.1 Gfo/Idh/MocA family oxidoreductase [bacterium]
MQNNNHFNRRTFLKNTVGAALGVSLVPASAWSQQNNVLPSNRLTLGFIGVGVQGGGLLRGFLNDPEFQVLAVCDVDDLKLKRAKDNVEKFYTDKHDGVEYKGCSAYRDFRDIISRADIDAVVIATPDHWHAIPSIMAMQAGKDVYCEKPLTLTISEGRAMTNVARRYERVFQTGSMQRSDQKFRFACELVRNGYIGEVKTVRVSIRTGFIPHPQICELPAETVLPELDWDLWLGPAPQRPYNSIIAPPISFNGYPAWRNYRDYSGGGMTDWGAHHFDIAQWGLGMDNSGPVEIIPPNGKDVTLLTYRYANGIEMTADFEDNYILFTGAKGTVKVNRSYLQTTPASLVNVRLTPGEIHLYKSTDHKKDWLQCIKTRSKPITDVEIGHRSVSVCHLGNQAVQLGRKLQWNPDKEQFVNDPEANRLLSRAKRSPWNI